MMQDKRMHRYEASRACISETGEGGYKEKKTGDVRVWNVLAFLGIWFRRICITVTSAPGPGEQVIVHLSNELRITRCVDHILTT